MKICSTIIFLSSLAVLAVVIGCADDPLDDTEDTLSRTTVSPGRDEEVAMAPQGDAEADKASARLLRFFPEFFPGRVDHSIPLNEIFHGGPLKDGIPALTNPRTIPAAAADYMRNTDIVLGITINGESRAYPWRILNWHEIVNDTLGGRPILVTLCPLCGTGIAFDPVVDGKVLEFGVSGMLHNDPQITVCRETLKRWRTEWRKTSAS